MEDDRLPWIWTRSENLMGATFHGQESINPIFGDSWEEQAFAEDASGGLGWPPRSYSCSFCRREFRSAQALGGHMNVHRRDRARLKQLPSPQTEILSYTHDLEVNKPIFSHVHQYPSWVGTHVYNPKPKEPYDDGILEKNQKKPSILLPSKVDQDLETKMSKKGGCDDRTIDLSINLKLVDKPCLSFPPSEEEEEEFVALKRRRIESSLIVPLIIPKPSLIGMCHPSEGLMEGLDLELRLGDPPKVK